MHQVVAVKEVKVVRLRIYTERITMVASWIGYELKELCRRTPRDLA